jgi:predicted transcriptional regulator
VGRAGILDTCREIRRLAGMEVDSSAETEDKLKRAAEECGSDSAECVRELVEHYLDYDSWFRRKVNRGIKQLDAGQYLTSEGSRGSHHEVIPRIDRFPEAPADLESVVGYIATVEINTIVHGAQQWPPIR